MEFCLVIRWKMVIYFLKSLHAKSYHCGYYYYFLLKYKNMYSNLS